MRFIENTNFPDFSWLQERLSELFAPIDAEVLIQYPSQNFNVASTTPTVTVSIEKMEIYDRFNRVDTDAPLVSAVDLGFGIYVPKRLDSATCYRLFSEIANLLFTADLGVEKVGCNRLEYLPDLRHYCLKGEVALKPQNVKEGQDGDTNV